MNRSLWKWLFAISLSLNAGILGAVAFNALRTPAQQEEDRHLSLQDRLNLAGEQRAQWSRIEQGFLSDLAANWHEIRSHREALVRKIFSTVPDRAAINQEQRQIAALQDAQQRRVIDQLLAEKELLDEHQRTLLMELLLARYAQEATEEEMLHRQ